MRLYLTISLYLSTQGAASRACTRSIVLSFLFSLCCRRPLGALAPLSLSLYLYLSHTDITATSTKLW